MENTIITIKTTHFASMSWMSSQQMRLYCRNAAKYNLNRHGIVCWQQNISKHTIKWLSFLILCAPSFCLESQMLQMEIVKWRWKNSMRVEIMPK